jgi:hypothetical protein
MEMQLAADLSIATDSEDRTARSVGCHQDSRSGHKTHTINTIGTRNSHVERQLSPSYNCPRQKLG